MTGKYGIIMVGVTDDNPPETGTKEPISLSEMKGNGTEEYPYVITNVHELQAINQGLTCVFTLGCDINATKTKRWNDGKGFNPIGLTKHNGGEPFTGYLDGDGFSIKNMYINRPNENNVGLFSVIDSECIIDSLTLENAHVVGDFAVGSIVGFSKNGNVVGSKIKKSTIAGNNVVGGFVGWNLTESSILNVDLRNTFIKGSECIGKIVGENSGYVITVNMNENTCSIGESQIGNYCGFNRGYIKPNQ